MFSLLPGAPGSGSLFFREETEAASSKQARARDLNYSRLIAFSASESITLDRRAALI